MRIINPKNAYGKRLLDVDDLSNATITIRQGGVTAGAFSLNQSADLAIDLATGDGSSSGTPAQRIAFTSQDTQGVVAWNGAKATFTHQLDGKPQVVVFDSEGEQAMLDIEYVDDAHFTLDFVDREAVTGTWTAKLLRINETDGLAGSPIYYSPAVTLDPTEDATIEPGKIYIWNPEDNLVISATDIPDGYVGSSQLIINPDEYFIVFDGIQIAQQLVGGQINICTVSWIDGNKYLTVAQ